MEMYVFGNIRGLQNRIPRNKSEKKVEVDKVEKKESLGSICIFVIAAVKIDASFGVS